MTNPSRLLACPIDEDVQRWLKAGADWRLASGEQERIWQAIAAEAGSVAATLAVVEVASKATQVAASAGSSAGSAISAAESVASVGAGSTKLTLLVVALKAVGVGLGLGAGLLVGGNAVKSHYIDSPTAIAPTLAPTSAGLVDRAATKSARLGTNGSAPADREDRPPREGAPEVSLPSVPARAVSERTEMLRASAPSAAAQTLDRTKPLTTTQPELNSTQSTAKQGVSSTLPSANRDAVREESRLVSAVRSALRQRSAASALALLSELDQRYPSGLLGEERAVLRIETLVLDGQSGEASRRAERFIARYPTSLNLDHVRAMVGSSRRGVQ
ncbi:MAG TPA: outer membrane protein assembly factor BamD [Polyangiaceae bacterium]